MPRLSNGTATREHNAARWRRLVDDYSDSTLSQRAFCARHGVALSSFTRWRRRLAGTSPPSASSDEAPSVRAEGFVPVRLARPTPSGSMSEAAAPLHLQLPGGLRIENIEAGNVSVVAALVAAL